MGRRMKVAVDHGSGEGPEERGTLVAATRGRSGLDRDIPIKNNSPHRLSSIVDRRPAFYSGINRAGWRRKLSSSPLSPTATGIFDSRASGLPPAPPDKKTYGKKHLTHGPHETTFHLSKIIQLFVA